MENKTRYAVGNLSINLDGGGQKHPDIISPAMPESGQGRCQRLLFSRIFNCRKPFPLLLPN